MACALVKSRQYVKKILRIERADVSQYSTRHFVADLLMINLTGVALLDQQALAPAGHRAERNNHILKRHRHGTLQDLLELLPMLSQPQLDIFTSINLANAAWSEAVRVVDTSKLPPY